MQLVNSGCLNMFQYIQRVDLSLPFLNHWHHWIGFCIQQKRAEWVQELRVKLMGIMNAKYTVHISQFVAIFFWQINIRMYLVVQNTHKWMSEYIWLITFFMNECSNIFVLVVLSQMNLRINLKNKYWPNIL